jgi:acyl-CoA thioesterase FadM
MARIKVNLPEKFFFQTEMAIRVTDINYGNHLGNDSVLGLVHEARVRFLASLGYTEKDIEGTGIIMTDAVLNYKTEGKLGETLVVEIGITDISRVGCDLVYRLTEKKSGREIALAKTGIMFYDYHGKKRSGIPAGFLEKIQY